MELFTPANSIIVHIKKKAMDYSYGLMARFMRDSGIEAKQMDTVVSCFLKAEKRMKENGRTIRRMVRADIFMLMVLFMKASGSMTSSMAME